MPMFIDDQPGRSMPQISAVARRLKRRFGLSLVIIDYLQLIEPEERQAPREQQIAQITRRLKYLAKELNLPVIALAQLNRASNCAKTSVRGSPTCAKAARSSKTPTWSCSCIARPPTTPKTAPARPTSSSPKTATARSAP